MTEKDISSALAVLEPVLADPDVLEIMVDAPDRVIVERQGQLVDAGIRFESPEALRAAIDAVLALGGAAFKPGQTVADARLSDGTRVLAVVPPTAVNGPYLVVRKVPAGQPTWEQLLEWGSVSREVLALFQSAIRAHCNIVIAGGTGSGKTTVLNRLTELIPPDERVVVVEAFYELQVRHPRAVRLCSDSSPDLSFADLVGTAAKMRPDRLIFGELRGPEVMHILDVIGMGHDGSLMTIHATSPEDTLTRIEAMCLTANLGLGIGEIRNLIASAIDVISVQQRLPDGSRKIVQVAELRGVENDRYVLQPLVRYDPEAGRFEFTGVKPGWEQS